MVGTVDSVLSTIKSSPLDLFPTDIGVLGNTRHLIKYNTWRFAEATVNNGVKLKV
jgi:hypothetical protein